MDLITNESCCGRDMANVSTLYGATSTVIQWRCGVCGCSRTTTTPKPTLPGPLMTPEQFREVYGVDPPIGSTMAAQRFVPIQRTP